MENSIKHKRASDKLRLLESAVVHANDAIIILEPAPSELPGRRILYVNEAFTHMTGYTLEEASRTTLRMLRGPKTGVEELNKIRGALTHFKPVRVELVNYRKDGSEFWAECNIVPVMDEFGKCIHWVSVQRDISERKEAEAEREKLLKEIEIINEDLNELNQELETIGAERTMSLMALTVADRIRNPVSMIGGRCRRILEKEEISERQKESLHYIIEGAKKLEKIVLDFETLLKNRQSKFKHDDLNAVVERIASVIEKEADFKGVKIVLNITSESMKINMQRDLLRVAIFHIMKNAVEVTSKGDSITVETCRDGENVVLSVSDTGPGIPDEHVDNVFKPFFSTKEKGFGLGLPLVRQIVSEHLGEVTIEDNRNGGTTFKISFPLRWKEERFFSPAAPLRFV